jgi:hypothetical protein
MMAPIYINHAVLRPEDCGAHFPPCEMSGETFIGDGYGIEIIERDSNYLKFFMSLLRTIKL